jgi:hypothetical protein
MVTGLYIVAQRHYPIEYEAFRLLKIVTAGGIIYFVGQTMVDSPIYELGILLCYPLLLISMRFFYVEEMDYLKRRIGFGVKNSG